MRDSKVSELTCKRGVRSADWIEGCKGTLKTVYDYLLVANVQWHLSMHQRRKNEKFRQFREIGRGMIVGLREAIFSNSWKADRVLLSSSTVIRGSKQCTDDNRTTRKTGSERKIMTSASNGRHLFCMALIDLTSFKALGSTMVYWCRCINIGFDNSSTNAALWTACKGAFMKDTLHGKPSTVAFRMGSLKQRLASRLAASCLFRSITVQFVGPWWHRSC